MMCKLLDNQSMPSCVAGQEILAAVAEASRWHASILVYFA